MPDIKYDPKRWNQQAAHFEAELRELVDNHTAGNTGTPWHVIATVALTLAAAAACRCAQWDARFFRLAAARAFRGARDALRGDSLEWAKCGPRFAMFPKPHEELTDAEIEAEQRDATLELQAYMRTARERVHDETIAYVMLRVATAENIRLGGNPLRILAEVTDIMNQASAGKDDLSPFAEAELALERDLTPPRNPDPTAN